VSATSFVIYADLEFAEQIKA